MNIGVIKEYTEFFKKVHLFEIADGLIAPEAILIVRTFLISVND